MPNATDRSLTLDSAPDVLTVPQYCEIFQVSTDHVYRLIRRGDLPVIRLGTAIRISKAKVREQLTGATA